MIPQAQRRQNIKTVIRTIRCLLARSTGSLLSAVSLLLFGGLCSSGQAPTLTPGWNQLSPSMTPPARSAPGLAYDAATAQVVMFGGSNLNDTWAWNGTDWTNVSPSSGNPPARRNMTMSYDAAANQVVMFGGNESNTTFGDTWLWNGTSWSQVTGLLPGSTSPPARSNAFMAYDAATQQVVLFGGADTNGNFLGDTWVWNGTTWTQKAPAASPSPRDGASIAYDAALGEVILFGGFDGINFDNDLWAWNGSSWTPLSPVNTPPPGRFGAAMEYDAVANQVVIFGGVNSSGRLGDTWVLAGTSNSALTWTQQAGTGPSARNVSGIAYDAAQGAILLFGGSGSGGDLGDTWTWGTSQNFGNVNVCPSGQFTPVPCSSTMPLIFSFTASSTTVASIKVLTQGQGNPEFNIAQIAGTNCINTWTAGNTCTVLVTFTPQAAGLRPGAVELLDNSGNLLVTAPIYGIGQAPEIAFTPGMQTTEPTSGLHYNVGVALDGAGNLYIADYVAGKVVKVTPGGVQTTVLSAYTSAPLQTPAPIGVAVDGAGNLFIADLNLSYAVELTPNGVQTTVGSGLGRPIGIAVDGMGDAFIAEQNNDQVVEVTPNGVQTTVPTTGLQQPNGVAVDAAGDVFISDSKLNEVVKVTPGGVQTTVPATGLSDPYGLAVDAAGDVFIADGFNARVVEVTPSGVQTTVGSGLNFPSGLTLDASGDVFIGDQGSGEVFEVIRSQAPSLNFGSVNVGARSEDIGVSIQNVGNQQLTGSVAPASNGNFADDLVNSTCTSVNGISLTPAATCFLGIYAQPQTAGVVNGTVAVSDNSLNATSATQAIALQVTGASAGINPTLTVSPIGTGTGTVTDNLSAISCNGSNGSLSGTCIASYQNGTLITLTANPAPGSVFLGWGGACTGFASTCQVSLIGTANVTASFVQQNYGSINVCQPGQTTPAPCSESNAVTINVPTTTTIGAVQVVTQGATGLDFTQSPGGTCVGTITGGTACTVNVNFSPRAPGLRLGAVELFDTNGNMVASTPIYGIGLAPLAAFSPGVQLPVNTGMYSLNYPNGLLTDAAGNLFIADGDNQRVLKVAPNGSVTPVASGLVLPQGMAEDGAGDLFIADNSNQVVEIPAGCANSSCHTLLPNPLGLLSELGVAVDGAGNLFVGDFLDGKVAEVPVNGGPQTIVYNPTGCGNAPGCSDPVDLTTDAAGDLFIADFGLKTVAEVPPGCTTNSCVKHIGTGWSQPDDVAVDAAGDVFVADQGLGQIVEVPAGCNNSACQIVLASGVYTVAVKVDAAGNLFFDNVTTKQIFEVTRSLPPSLGFALTNVGSPSTDSPQAISVQNVGNQNLSISVSATSTTSFSEIPSGSTCSTIPPAAVTLTPGAICKESFTFTPQSPGILSDSAIFSDNTLNLATSVSLQTVNLSGIGSLNGATGTVVPNVVGMTEAAAATVLADAGLTLANVSSGYSSSEPAGSVAGENPAAGSQVSLGTPVNLLIAIGEAPAPAPNPLLFENNYFVTGDFATAGLSLRGMGSATTNTASGIITIPDSTSGGVQGVPDGADIVDGLLYWETLENTATPSGNAGTFLGYPITGQQVGIDVSYTDGALTGTLRVYRANVNNYFQAPMNFNGERLGSGPFGITLPDSGGSRFPLNEGASMVVIYRVLVPPSKTSGNQPSYPLKSVVIYDGSTIPTTATPQTVKGFYDALGTNGELATLYSSGGTWNGTPSSVPLAAHASSYSVLLNPNNAYAAVIFSTPVTNSDNDGILNAWKAGPASPDFFAGEPGYYDVKTQSWVSLPGATHGQKDLFVQLDYMCGNVLSTGPSVGQCDPSQENLFPAADANGNDPLAMVQQAFKQSGIILHLEMGNAVAESSCMDTAGQPLCVFPSTSANPQPGIIGWKNSLEFSKLWPRNYDSCVSGGDCTTRFPYGQKDSYHYVLFGHSLAIPAWSTRFGSLVTIHASAGTGQTTITTTSRGNDTRANINYCPSRFTISGVLGDPALNGTYNTASCPDGQTIILSTPGVTEWSYPNTTLPEPDISLTSGTVTSISGYSDLGGQDSAVTLGQWLTLSSEAQNMSTRANVIAGTLFHEIGHTIGLSHGGIYYQGAAGSYIPSFDINCKPNYESSMNYLFQLDGVGPNAAVAYSNQTLESLTESTLGGVSNLVDVNGAAANFTSSSWYTVVRPSTSTSQASLHCDGTLIGGAETPEYRVVSGSVVNPGPGWTQTNEPNITFDGVLAGSTGLPGLLGYNDLTNIDLRQVGATGGEYASLASVLSFGSSSTPLSVPPGGSANVGPGGTATVPAGGSVTLINGGNVTVGSGAQISGGGTITFVTGTNVTFSANATNNTITAGKSGVFTLPVGGPVVLNNTGTVTLTSGGTITFPASNSTISVNFTGGATLNVGGASVTIPSEGGSYTIPITGATITLPASGSITMGGGGSITMGGGGSITMGGGGSITMGGGGSITMGGGGIVTVGNAGDVSIGSGGTATLGLGGSVTVGIGGSVTVNSSSGSISLSSGGSITMGGGGSITMGGGGNQIILGASGGTVNGVSEPAGYSTNLASGGIIGFPAGGSVTLTSGGSITMGGGGSITMGGGGSITMGGGGSITMGGGGVVSLGGAGGSITMGGGGSITMGGGGSITMGGGGTTIDEMTFATADSVVRPPSAPTYSISGGNVQVNWTAPAFGVVQTYTITREVVDSNGNVLEPATVIGSVSGVGGNAPATTFTDTNPPTTGTLIYTIATGAPADVNNPAPRSSAPSTPAVLTQGQTIVLGPLPSSVVLGNTQPTTISVTATAESNATNTANMQLVSFSTSGPCSAGTPSIDMTTGISSATITLSSTGSCTITASQLGDSTKFTNPPAYSAATPVSGTFTILPQGSTTKSQTITLGPVPNVKYGSNGFSVSAASNPSGLAVSFKASGPCAVGTTTNTASGTVTGAGLCTITATAPAGEVSGTNYSAASVTQSFNIAAAPLTVAAINLSSTYGQPLPSLSPNLNVNYSLTGFVKGDTALVVSGAPALSTNATSTSGAGSYTITVSTGTLAAANYSFVYSNGTLTINAAGSTTAAFSQSATYNSNSQVAALSASVTSAAGTVNAGTVTFTVLNNGTPVGTATTSGTVTNGKASVNYTLPAGTAPGTYTIQAVYNGSTDFTGSGDSTHTLTVKFTASAPPSGTSCNGAYNGTFNGNLTVTKGQNCVFVGGGTTGTITETGGNLVLNGSTVVGGVTVSGGTFSIGPSTTLKSTLVVQNLASGSTTNQVCGSTITGSIQFQKNQAPVLFGSGSSCAGNVIKSTVAILSNTAAVTLDGNKITGGVQVQSNSGTTTTDGNSIGGGLQIQSNTGAAQVFTNVISGSLQCQSNSSITGSGNTASSKTGQCAKF